MRALSYIISDVTLYEDVINLDTSFQQLDVQGMCLFFNGITIQAYPALTVKPMWEVCTEQLQLWYFL